MLLLKYKPTNQFFQSEYNFPDEGDYTLTDDLLSANLYSLGCKRHLIDYVLNFPCWEIVVNRQENRSVELRRPTSGWSIQIQSLLELRKRIVSERQIAIKLLETRHEYAKHQLQVEFEQQLCTLETDYAAQLSEVLSELTKLGHIKLPSEK